MIRGVRGQRGNNREIRCEKPDEVPCLIFGSTFGALRGFPLKEVLVGDEHSAQCRCNGVDHQRGLVRQEADGAERTSRVTPEVYADIT